MKPISLTDIARITGAMPLDAISPQTPLIHAICTDSRKMQPQSLFIALRGDNFDGHQYLEAAASGDAIAALVDRPPRPPGLPPTSLHCLLVPDTRMAMGQLARHVRLTLRAKVIGVAGSNGKTSTKHLIDSVLRPVFQGSMSPKSFNNDIGVPLAIFPANSQQDYLILEMGTNHRGEIRTLTNIALPDIGVITNCSLEHLQGLGDIDGVRRENASIIEGMSANGTLIVQGDDPRLLAITAAFPGKRITFGFGPHNDLMADNIVCGADGTWFTVSGIDGKVFVPLLGRHSAINSLAAMAVGREMGLADHQILMHLCSATAPEMRLQMQESRGVRVLNDAYNANPASMRAALETLANLPAEGRRLAVLGDMKELGETSPEHHRQVGRWCARDFPPDELVCIGPLSATVAQTAIAEGLDPAKVKHYPSVEIAVQAIRPRPGDLILLKGSRAMGLEAVAKALMECRTEST